MRFPSLSEVDREEAVDNLDRAFEAKLEAFHTLYDVCKGTPGFEYFEHGDTSLLIALRNALHHRDHGLFESLLARTMRVEDLAGAEFLLAGYAHEEGTFVAEYYLPFHDFLERLKHPSIKKPSKLQALWERELGFGSICSLAKERKYPDSQVYIDVAPIFISALRRVVGWLEAASIAPKGFDGNTYRKHFVASKGRLGSLVYGTIRV